MGSLTLKRMQVGPFQGIDTNRPIVLEFPKQSAKTKKRPIIKLSGDQGVGKSSFLHALLYATAQGFGIKDQNLVNIETGKMNGEFEFDKDGESWKVVYTKTTFKLYRLFVAEDDQGWIPQGAEDSQLKRLIGNVAISPMKLKVDDGKKQVDWLFNMLNVPATIVEKTRELGKRIKEVGGARSSSNAEYNFLKKQLSEDPLYTNWEESEKKYAEKKDAESVKQKLDALGTERVRLQEGREKLARIKQKITDQEKDLVEVEKKITELKKSIAELKESREKGENFIKQNNKLDKQWELVQQELIDITAYLSIQKRWEVIKTKKAEMEEFEDLIQNGDRVKSDLLKQKRDLLAGILPDINGLDVQTDDEIDGLKAGIYLHGRNPFQLSESELFDLYLQLCKAQGVTMVVVENITSFGSDVITNLNALAKAGVYVWASEMARGKNELKIEFVDAL